MASKWINAILWTLVSVNLITLVLGGLVTWLGYAIPIRLKQFGLSPEITQMAGFASLLVACLGLGGLNYSSHYAMNAYGLSCVIFIILMLFGALPSSLQRAIYSPSQAIAPLDSHQHQQTTAAINATATSGSSSPRLKPPGQHGPHGTGLILDLLYIMLLFLLSVLVALAVIFAQHLRRRELEEDEELTATDRCDQELGILTHSSGSDGALGSGGVGGGISAGPMTAARRRLLSSMHFDDMATDWSCTCNDRTGARGGGIIMGGHAGQVLTATMGPANMVAPNKEAASHQQCGPESNDEEEEEATAATVEEEEEEDKILFMQRIIAGVSTGRPHQPVSSHDAIANNDQANSLRWRSSQSATPNRWSGGTHHSSRLAKLATGDNDNEDERLGKLGGGAHRLSSKSLVDLASSEPDTGHGGVIGNNGQRQEAVGAEKLHVTSAARPLVHKGIYYASRGEHQTDEHLVGLVKATWDNGASLVPNHLEYHSANNTRQMQHKYNDDDANQHEQQRFRLRTQDELRCCCWSELPMRSCHSSRAAATLAAKLNPAINCNEPLLDDYYHQSRHQHHHHHSSHSHSHNNHQHQHSNRNGSAGRSVYNPHTMPSKLSLSSVQAMRSTTLNPSSRAHETASRKHKQSKLSSGSVMAMTASAAAALLGGVALDPGAFSGHDHGGQLANSSLMDDGLDYADAFMDHHGNRCAALDDAGHLDECANIVPSSSSYTPIARQHH